MVQSSFIKYIQKYFPGIVINIVEKLNDDKRPLTYLHRRMLRKDFSVDGKWTAISAAYSRVAADVVAMDSQLPLKKRDAISRANGDIPKMGMALWLNENQLTALDTLVAMGAINGANDKLILQKLFEDTPKCIEGVYERLEYMFLQGLSTGVTSVIDTENVGTEVRVDFGYMTANKFGTSVVWSGNASTAKPFDDINKMLIKAQQTDGNKIVKILIDRATLNNLLATTQAKELYAFSIGYVGASTPLPNLEQINRMALSNYGFQFEVVERSVRVEKNGAQTTLVPWEAGMLVALTQDNVGSLIWSKLAEMNHPVPAVSYQTADDFILVSKYRKHDPVSEWTSSQARVLPVISNVDQIYQLDSTEVQA